MTKLGKAIIERQKKLDFYTHPQLLSSKYRSIFRARSGKEAALTNYPYF